MKIISVFSVLSLCLLLTSCSGLSQKEIAAVKEPVKVIERTSDYSEALDKFSALLKVYGEPQEPLLLLGKTIVNKTACGSLPMDVTQMMTTAVNQISGNIHYVVYNPEYTELEIRHFQNSTRVMPKLVFDGAITECDENLETKEVGSDASATGTYHGQEGEIAGNRNKTFNISRLALDLHLMEYTTSMPLARIQSKLAVDIKTARGGYQFAVQVLGSGFGMNRTHKITQGKHDAIRALVNLSVLQVLGKYLQVPYWRCLPDATPDREVIWMLEEVFARATPAQAIGAIQQELQYHKYNVQVTGVMDEATKQAISRVSAASNGKAPAVVSPGLYSYLYVNRPIQSWRPNLMVNSPTEKIIDFQQQLAAARAQALAQEEAENTSTNDRPQAPPAQPPAQEQEQPAPPIPEKHQQIQPMLGLQTAVIYRPGKLGEMVLISGGTLRSGDKYKVVVAPEQDCYLYVFQRDSGGRLFPLFPRSDRTDGLINPVQGKRSYEFPGKGQYFYLDQRKGEEFIYFYSTSKPDAILEKAVQQLNQQLPEIQKKQIEKEVLAYLMSKETVTATDTGKSLELHGSHGTQSIQMNRVTRLDRNKLYVFPFKHQ